MYWTKKGTIRTNALGGGGGAEGTELQIKGVSWFGLESKPCSIGGLEQMPVDMGAAFLRKNGFNAVRIPLAVNALLDRSPDAGCMPAPLASTVDEDMPASEASIMAGPGVTFVTSSNDGSTRGYKTNNPTYMQLGYVRLLQRFVTTLGDNGLLVMLDLHAAEAGKWPDDGKEHSPGNLKAAWAILANLFCDPVRYWNVFAADLRNEPHGCKDHVSHNMLAASHAVCSNAIRLTHLSPHASAGCTGVQWTRAH